VKTPQLTKRMQLWFTNRCTWQ